MSLFAFVKSQISILDVVREYVQLRQAGSYWKGSCPFHVETDASFTVSPDRQIFYCFGCHATGDLIGFVAKAENVTQIQATRHLIERHQLKIPSELEKVNQAMDQDFDARDRHTHLCEAIAQWAHEQLEATQKAQDYLNQRCITPDNISYFQLGFFPGGLRAVNRFIKAMTRQNILLKSLIEAGIVVESGAVVYSPFEDRIIFPIRDSLGRCCGFGGRIFKPRDQRPKYYNSKESPYFVKGGLLFGFDKAKRSMQELGHGYLVEGYTDCIAMVKHGYPGTVATLGTACTREHLGILARHITKLYVLYDGDKAGEKAIIRLAQLCWGVNLDLCILRLPVDEDPASYLEKQKDLKELMSQECDIFTFFVQVLGESFAQKSLAEKLAVGEKIVGIIGEVNDSFKRDLLLLRAVSVLQLPLPSLQALLARHKRRNDDMRNPVAQEGIEGNDKKGLVFGDESDFERLERAPSLEKQILFAIINNAQKEDRIESLQELLPYFSEQMRSLLELYFTTIDSRISQSRFLAFYERLSQTQRAWVSSKSMVFDRGVSAEFFDQLVMQFRKQKWKIMVQRMKSDLAAAKHEGDEERFQALTNRFLGLKQEMKSKGVL